MCFKWLKRRNCAHDFEIVTRGNVRTITRPYERDIIEYYHITTATCVNCGLKKELDKQQVSQKVVTGQLLKVHKDPKHIYDWFRREEALDELRNHNKDQ